MHAFHTPIIKTMPHQTKRTEQRTIYAQTIPR